MEEPIIKIEGLGKRYKLGASEPYLSLRDQLAGTFTKKKRQSKEEFWALKDINLEINRGDTIGIIGRNGAGKSTLLKILSQITPPTEGKITIDGRIASLLEVGTGFHPELTGRENIYLNGAILGMTRNEIKRKFDEIVAFSEIEKFLDTPVKRYSSGMYVRLAFAVAAHLEPEILIVDEVLAVGDAQFQKKCLGKMKSVSGEGRTVIFVSHNMAAISDLCNRCILLEKGKIVEQGNTPKVINLYMNQNNIDDESYVDLAKTNKRRSSVGESLFNWKSIKIFNSQKKQIANIKLGEPFKLVFEAVAKENVSDIQIGFSVASSAGVFVSNSLQTDNKLTQDFKKGTVSFTISFDQNILSPDGYSIDLSARGSRVYDWIPEALSFHVFDFASERQANVIPWGPHHGGCVRLPCDWKIKNES